MDSATYYLKECNSGYFFEWNYLAQTNIKFDTNRSEVSASNWETS
jgi:hypothetical protein